MKTYVLTDSLKLIFYSLILFISFLIHFVCVCKSMGRFFFYKYFVRNRLAIYIFPIFVHYFSNLLLLLWLLKKNENVQVVGQWQAHLDLRRSLNAYEECQNGRNRIPKHGLNWLSLLVVKQMSTKNRQSGHLNCNYSYCQLIEILVGNCDSPCLILQ